MTIHRNITLRNDYKKEFNGNKLINKTLIDEIRLPIDYDVLLMDGL